MMVIASQISTSDVTPEQIGRCYKVHDYQTKSDFYQVESEQDNGDTYQVRWSCQRGFTCTCKSGQCGFSNTKHGYCKHIKWALAAAKEERTALAELAANLDAAQATPARPAAPSLIVDGKPADAETLARVYNAKPTQGTGRPGILHSNAPFQLMR